MPDDVHINLSDLSQETVQTLIDGVASLLSAFAGPDYDGSATLSPQLARELYGIAGIEDVDGIGPWEQLCIETGFHTGVWATVACIGILTPEFRERLRERLHVLRQSGEDPAAEDVASVPDAAPEDGQRITTVYKPNWEDPKVHHPYEGCPERQRMMLSGDREEQRIFASAADKWIEARRMRRNLGRRERQDLKPCANCLTLRAMDNWPRP